jgi:phosphoglycolate phosphatase/beta-phosphoglucomutase
VIRALLFGFHGVLFDDAPLHAELQRRLLAEEGLTPPPAPPGGRAEEDEAVFAAALAAAGAAPRPDRIASWSARKAAWLEEEIRRVGLPPAAGAGELVRAAAAAGLPLGVVTRAHREEVRAALGRAGLAAQFKVLVTGESIDGDPADPEAYRLALMALNAEPPLPARLIHPHEVLVIESREEALAAARAAGLETVGVGRKGDPRLAAADQVVAFLCEIPLARLAAVS